MSTKCNRCYKILAYSLMKKINFYIKNTEKKMYYD